jgi:hypothetical protein
MFDRRLSKAEVMEGSVNELTDPVGTHDDRMVPLGRSISMNLCGGGSPASARSAEVSQAASGVALAARKNHLRD